MVVKASLGKEMPGSRKGRIENLKPTTAEQVFNQLNFLLP